MDGVLFLPVSEQTLVACTTHLGLARMHQQQQQQQNRSLFASQHFCVHSFGCVDCVCVRNGPRVCTDCDHPGTLRVDHNGTRNGHRALGHCTDGPDHRTSPGTFGRGRGGAPRGWKSESGRACRCTTPFVTTSLAMKCNKTTTAK